ncbi:MAG: tRNA uridine-5-carboxymethylaminomethyl(34) synthesis enzyme MnmG, partial [Tateyamaria sp.]|nr:tRNA uridine-5-carboxymethylaminomethyl(34) synthesis enzyme MnmG [Tateyamaria sp.]
TAFQLLAFPDVEFADIVGIDPRLSGIPKEIQEQISNDALYANYIDRQKRDVEKMRRDEQHIIPEDFEYSSISGLSNELSTKLNVVCPGDLAQAARIEGMTPAALSLILGRIRYLEKMSA